MRFNNFKYIIKKNLGLKSILASHNQSKNANSKSTTMQEELKNRIEDLRTKLTGDMFVDMDVKDEIHNLEMKLNGVKPSDSHFDCIGCGS